MKVVLILIILVHVSNSCAMKWTESTDMEINFHRPITDKSKETINFYDLAQATLGSLLSPFLALKELVSKYEGLQEQLYYELVLLPDDVEFNMEFNWIP